jgi:2-phospho-L-lactate guanylyltransferase
MRAIVLPVKDPANGKTRLAELLAPEARRELAAVMFADVARALSGVRLADGIFVVTSYSQACQRAKHLGFEFLLERTQQSESASVDWASKELEALGYDQVMRLPADIPLVTAGDIDQLLEVDAGRPGVVIVPSRDGRGTNSIIRTPPTVFPSRFGPDSLRLHSDEAGRMGIRPVIVTNERIALDIDEPADLAQILQCGRGTQTFAYIQDSRIAQALISAGSDKG